MASDLTKNSRSENFDRNLKKPDIENNPKKHSQTPGNTKGNTESQNMTNIKKSSRTFVPKEKKTRPCILQKGSFQLRILLESREVTRTINCELLKEECKEVPTITVVDKEGQQIVISIDVDDIARAINSEINPDIDLRWEMR